MGQCQGTTKKGEKCKIIIKDKMVLFCSYHVSQGRNNNSATKSLTPGVAHGQKAVLKAKLDSLSPKAAYNDISGYIYMFTMSHLLNPRPKQEMWLRQAPSSLNPSDLRHETTSEFDPRNYILIKVGYTTQPVDLRLKQWRAQCRQDFKLVSPSIVDDIIATDKKFSLLSLFKNMNIENDSGKRKNGKGLLTKRYNNFDYNSQAFVCKTAALKSEQIIHRQLREIYGFGKLYCEACLGNDRSINRSERSNRNGVHKEWFLVPRKSIAQIMDLIDESVI